VCCGLNGAAPNNLAKQAAWGEKGTEKKNHDELSLSWLEVHNQTYEN
jgi:hypothetical protein